jgi:hypothetical protein
MPIERDNEVGCAPEREIFYKGTSLLDDQQRRRFTQKSLDLYDEETQAFGRLTALHSLVVNSTFASCAKLTVNL